MDRKPVTIAVLASHLGLAKGTVSRALNDYSDISAATKRRVARAAQELGYLPNPAAQALAVRACAPILHLVRTTDNLSALRYFYVNGLGLDVISDRSDHLGNSSLIVGSAICHYRLEFKLPSNPPRDWQSRQDGLLVFCHSDLHDWKNTVLRMKTASFLPIEPSDSHSEISGQTFEDPDGYRILIKLA